MKSLLLESVIGVAAISSIVGFTQTSDWTAITSRDGSFTMSAPSGWMVADEKDPAYIKRFEEITKANPNIKSTFKKSENNDQILLLFNMNDTGEDGYVDNLNVIKKPHGGLTASMFPEVGKAITEQAKGSKVVWKVIESPNGKTLEYTMSMKLAVPDSGEISMDVLGYMLLKGDNMFIVTFGTKQGELKDKKATYEKMMKSIKL